MDYEKAAKGKSCSSCWYGPKCTCTEPDIGWTLELEPKCKRWKPSATALKRKDNP